MKVLANFGDEHVRCVDKTVALYFGGHAYATVCRSMTDISSSRHAWNAEKEEKVLGSSNFKVETMKKNSTVSFCSEPREFLLRPGSLNFVHVEIPY